MTKIAFFIPTLEGGGAEKVVVTIANSIVKPDWQIDMVLARAQGIWLKELDPNIHVINLNAKRTISSFFKLVRYLKEEKPDVLLSSLDFANVLAILAKRVSGFKGKVVIRTTCYVGHKSNYRSLFEWLVMRPIFPLVLPAADSVIAVSREVTRNLLANNVPEAKIHVIYNPINVEKIRALANQSIEHDWFRDPQNIPIIISVGSLTKAKDHKTLIKAFAIVRKNMPCRLIILGEGYLRAELQEQIEKLGLCADIDLAGFKENPFAYLNKSSVFVLSSITEGFPNVILQALACGCPVISTNYSDGVTEILEQGKYGLLVPPNNPDEMANAISQVLEGHYNKPVDPAWLDQFNLTTITNKYLEVLGF